MSLTTFHTYFKNRLTAGRLISSAFPPTSCKCRATKTGLYISTTYKNQISTLMDFQKKIKKFFENFVTFKGKRLTRKESLLRKGVSL